MTFQHLLMAASIALVLSGRAAAEQDLADTDKVAIGNWFCMWRSATDLGAEHQLRVARWSLFVAEHGITILERRTLPASPFARDLERATNGSKADQEGFCGTIRALTVQVAPQLLGLPRTSPYTGVKPAMPPLIDALVKIRICHGLRMFDLMSVHQAEAAVRLAAEANGLSEGDLAELTQRLAVDAENFRKEIVDRKSAESQCSRVRSAARSLMNLELKLPPQLPE
ncbi:MULTISPECIES: hypothetical protein [unclassified Shinella]|uniref:hypothetical protein n=1 Tax=unclassified Shinella TaxID=2643062 RepID=UPI00225DC8DF|nr:hypothetical protein [Shinella sp. YE25]MDC7259461.1 hypothetical protein [Shinella sp. YE25]CAI0341215.1 exported hypothetical protein [Rhizobiaceae bacterium]CAK7260858.1 exported protein of unknown function [Shinella sp. WSC3-e]